MKTRATAPGGRGRSLPPAFSAEYSEKPALLVDRSGIVRQATPQAAAILQRPWKDILGCSFGIIPNSWTQVELDVVTRDGSRCMLRAERRDSCVDGGIIVLLESAGADPSLARACHLALAEMSGQLAGRGVAVHVGNLPISRTPPETRALIVDSLRLLAPLADGSPRVLGITASQARQFATVELSLTSQEHPPDLAFSAADFDALLAHVERAGGFLNLQPTDGGLVLRLTLPL